MSEPLRRGIPTARNVDHFGVTVPDLDAAVSFFVDVLGADLLFGFNEGPGTDNPANLQKSFEAAPGSTLKVAMLRLGPTLNLELMEYQSAGRRTEMPKNDDMDTPHVAFFVEDMELAADYLRQHGCRLLEGPFTSDKGPKAGQSIHYFFTPWGMAMEILCRSASMPYEAQTMHRLFGPVSGWDSQP